MEVAKLRFSWGIPDALTVHDRFHISKHLNEAVDKVRCTEHRELQQTGDDHLKGMRQTLLFNPENLSDVKNAAIAARRKSTLATGRVRSIKGVVSLSPIRKVLRMLENRLDRSLSWFLSPISNGASE